MEFSVIFVTKTSNKSLKSRFWKEKPVENVFTLEGLSFNSSMILFHTWLFKNGIYLANNVIGWFTYILTWVHTWGNDTGHTTVTYFCLWLLHYQSAMPSLSIEKFFYSTATKLPAIFDFYKEKHNIENLYHHCMSTESFRGFNQ